MKFMNNHYGVSKIFGRARCVEMDPGAIGNGGGAGGGAGNEPGTHGAEEEAEGSQGIAEPPSFDDYLKNGGQSEFDKRIQKAINTALGNQQKKFDLLLNDSLTEAEKLAQMSEADKADFLVKKREKDLSDREAAITRKELMAEAKNDLVERKLPVALADMLNYADADSCKASIEGLDKAFREAVQSAVDEKLKGGDPLTRAPQSTEVTKEDFLKMGYAQRLELKTKNPEAYKKLSGN